MDFYSLVPGPLALILDRALVKELSSTLFAGACLDVTRGGPLEEMVLGDFSMSFGAVPTDVSDGGASAGLLEAMFLFRTCW